MKVYIYILQLDNGKIYVGRSKYPLKRIEDHRDGSGSKWTSIHKVIGIIDTFEGDVYDEDKFVKIYMNKCGIDNVRGGSYSNEILSNEQIVALKKELQGANDCCFRCGRNSHFAKDCYAKTHIDGHFINKTYVEPPKVIHEIVKPIQKIEEPKLEPKLEPKCLSCNGDHDIMDCSNKGSICYRCGRIDHWKITCTATHDINNKPLEPDIIGQVGSFIKSWWS